MSWKGSIQSFEYSQDKTDRTKNYWQRTVSENDVREVK